MTELIGSRVMLRPLRPDDWDGWREVRLRCRAWLERWEPSPDVGSLDPALDRVGDPNRSLGDDEEGDLGDGAVLQ